MCGITGYLGNGDAIERLLGGLRNLEYRGYDSAGIAIDDEAGVRERVDHAPTYPDLHPSVAGVLANAHLQRVSYLMADRLNRPIDKPRNLAKSVTVE